MWRYRLHSSSHKAAFHTISLIAWPTSQLFSFSSRQAHKRMSTIIEDPAIPLVGMNGKRGSVGRGGALQRMYTTRSMSRSEGGASITPKKPNPKFENVGIRLALRKELYAKRKKICDASLAMALVGIVLMIVETELAAAEVIRRTDITSIFLKMCVTASTVALLIFIFMYHKMGVQLFTVNNSMDNWRLAMRPRRLLSALAEAVICIVHPIPGEYYISWYTTESDGNLSDKPVQVPLDVILSLPMFLRLYLVCRFLMLHSRLYQDASCQSLGALNRIHFNFRFIFKSFMALYPDYFLAVFMVSLFIITSWTLRLCEMYNDAFHARVHGNFLNSMWLIAITFLTVGYGDIVPNSYCGRGIAVVTGIMGTGCTALIVAVLARKLELSQAEKYVHDFVLEIEIGNKLKIEAANIVKNGWKLYKIHKLSNKTSEDERVVLRLQTKLLHAIYNIRELKNRRRRLTDNAVTLVEVSKAQSEMHTGIDHVRIRQIAMEERMSRIETMMSQIYEKVCGPDRSRGAPTV
ncbi:small conductance calcium-activated potassium channel protein-like [Aplysia californica]|uniref:Small conductance calcium-activated potassium channel protein-like n=1 Tax=Aplysia californica TaxID=6500 RepID=A0ABM0JBT9_APLCA|nr:small conductance calcium-activated potassium channel protein-like [Aplysia californica]